MKRAVLTAVGVTCTVALAMAYETGAQSSRGKQMPVQGAGEDQTLAPPTNEVAEPGDVTMPFDPTLQAVTAGPDVIVGDLYNTANFGASGGIRAYAIGTYSCNIGDTPLQWNPATSNHPVIGQNLYRYKDGRFEHIGQSWVKHGFLALTDSLCLPCQNPNNGHLLGVGCADPYDASLNGSAGNLGPKSPINAYTGGFSNSYPSPSGTSVLRGRIQVDQNDVDPAQNAGARYFIEGHYVTPDDAAAGNQMNNTSWREVTINPTSFSLNFSGNTMRMFPAITRWAGIDPGAKTGTVDVPGDGRIYIGWHVTSNGDGTWDYEYAVYNQNSDRSVGAFSLPVGPDTVVTNIGFHDVSYHSGDNIDGTDWNGVVDAADYVVWRTAQTYAENPNGNAIRWGTLYNFRFTCDLPPKEGSVTLGLFKPAPVAGSGPDEVFIGAAVPDFQQVVTGACCLGDGQCLATVTEDVCVNGNGGTYQGDNSSCGTVSCPQPNTCVADMVDSGTFNPPGDGQVDGADLAYLLGEWGNNPGSPADIVDTNTFAPPPDGIVDGADLAYLLGEWGACD